MESLKTKSVHFKRHCGLGNRPFYAIVILNRAYDFDCFLKACRNGKSFSFLDGKKGKKREWSLLVTSFHAIFEIG